MKKLNEANMLQFSPVNVIIKCPMLSSTVQNICIVLSTF